MTPHLSRLVETVQMSGHNICFYAVLIELSLIITKYSLLRRALYHVNCDVLQQLFDFAELLLQNSADLSCVDELQNTALHYSCMNVSIQVTPYLSLCFPMLSQFFLFLSACQRFCPLKPCCT